MRGRVGDVREMRLCSGKLKPPTHRRPQNTDERRRMATWKDQEVRELLTIRADAEIVKQMQGTARDAVMYERITALLEDQGIKKTKQQVNNKLKMLKRQYHQVVDHNNRSGNGRKTFPYYDLCEAIWGSRHSTRPVALSSTMQMPCMPELASHSEEATSDECREGLLTSTAETLSSSDTAASCIENDTNEASGSMDESVLSQGNGTLIAI